MLPSHFLSVLTGVRECEREWRRVRENGEDRNEIKKKNWVFPLLRVLESPFFLLEPQLEGFTCLIPRLRDPGG